jgi:hypothetical protein
MSRPSGQASGDPGPIIPWVLKWSPRDLTGPAYALGDMFPEYLTTKKSGLRDDALPHLAGPDFWQDLRGGFDGAVGSGPRVKPGVTKKVHCHPALDAGPRNDQSRTTEAELRDPSRNPAR